MRNLKRCLAVFLVLLLIAGCQREVLAENKIPIVNAGKDTTYQLLSSLNDTIQLSGSATDPDGTVVGYLWSQVSGPNTAKILFPGSASTKVSGVTGGQYLFQLMATDDKGATGIKSVNITVSMPQMQTLVLQPHQNTQEVLLAVIGTSDYSDAVSTEIDAAAWTSNGISHFVRGLLKFNFGTIPSNARIVSAKLSLYSNPTPANGNQIDANHGGNNTLLLQRVTSNWNLPLTWHTQPSTDAATQIIIPHTSQPRLDLIDLDVTALVKDMQQLGNYGFIIRLQNEVAYNSRIFCSSKHADAGKRPKLVIQYAY